MDPPKKLAGVQILTHTCGMDDTGKKPRRTNYKPVKKARSRVGRPTAYNQGIHDAICRRLSSGETLTKICSRKPFPSIPTVYEWLDRYPEFAKDYAIARTRQAHYCADYALDTAARAKDAATGRLRWDALRWHASKMAPKLYGERVTQEQTGPGGGPVQIQAVPLDLSRLTDEELATYRALLAKLAGAPE